MKYVRSRRLTSPLGSLGDGGRRNWSDNCNRRGNMIDINRLSLIKCISGSNFKGKNGKRNRLDCWGRFKVSELNFKVKMKSIITGQIRFRNIKKFT